MRAARSQAGMRESEGDRLQQARCDYMQRALEHGAVQEVRSPLPPPPPPLTPPDQNHEESKCLN
jgi:hypothetical protein